MHKIERVTGTGLPLFLDEIDTDRIIPARFLRCVTFEGLGQHAFEDDRRQDPSHPFDDPRYRGASILIVGRNFGCGSSREHAPQALMRFGIKAIVGESFAEIFFGNCTALGIPCVSAPRCDVKRLADAVVADAVCLVTVDLVEDRVCFGESSITITMPDGPRAALVSGEFDFLGQLMAGEPQILQTARKLPYMSNFS